MAYGPHIDDALMTPQRLRTDVSVTIFLNDPSEYEGGELCIPPGYGVKLPVGSLIAYPSSTIHEVRPVLSGTRIVAAFWVESLVRDPAKREILYDLDVVCRHLFQQQGKTPEYDRLSKTRANLLRSWVE